VFCLLGAMLWVLRGRTSFQGFRLPGNNKDARSLESLDRLVLTPQHSLHLIRLRDKEVLLATYPQGCTVISESAEVHKAMHA
jgi:hypothetical protein